MMSHIAFARNVWEREFITNQTIGRGSNAGANATEILICDLLDSLRNYSCDENIAYPLCYVVNGIKDPGQLLTTP